ncbi:brain protein I3-like [Asterias rubens]|uniref:brain protein I3-like n=1 Tax=Asterias rubens TaxID=7604 RepID=UPI0014554AA9|nr:brain protein I3-like [Asterias rubens]
MESEKKMDEQPGAVSPPAYGAYYDQPAGGPDGGPVATGGGYPVYPPAQPGQGGYPPPPPGGYPPQGQTGPPNTQGYPPQQPGYPPQQQHGYPPPQQQGAPHVVVHQQQPATQVVVVGNCPTCHAGVITDSYTACGIILAICLFPIGIICCLMMKERRCTNCNATF